MFEGAKEWKKSVDKSVYLPNGQPIPCVLLVNKVSSIIGQRLYLGWVSRISRCGCGLSSWGVGIKFVYNGVCRELTRSHGPIRFAGDDVIVNLMGPIGDKQICNPL